MEFPMSGGAFILAINLSGAALLAAAFGFIAAYDRTAAAPRWMALSYVLGTLYVALEFLVGLLPDARLAIIGAYMSFALGLAAFNLGIARNYDVPLALRVNGALLLLALATILLHGGQPRLELAPMVLYQLPYALLQCFGAFQILRAPRRGRLDIALSVLLVLSALHFVGKPLIGLALGSIGNDARDYLATTYALFSQTISAMFFIAIALGAMIVMMRDLLATMALESETDPLTGVLNRRGFEERAQSILRIYEGSRVPLSLMLCDLDHFKLVNDTYGHHTGDLVLAAFGRELTAADAGGQIVGRIGGEEFAVMLPGANIAVARLFAENLRSNFASLQIMDAPPGRTFTASFGLAELQPGESFRELMGRADTALYQAKTAGRDCVRVAPPKLAVPPSAAAETRTANWLR